MRPRSMLHALVVLALSASATAREAPGIDRVELAPGRYVFVKVQKPIVLKGHYGAIREYMHGSARWRVEAGTYRANWGVRYEGREYALIPYVYKTELDSRGSTTRVDCIQTYDHVLVDIASGKVLPRTYIVKEDNCPPGPVSGGRWSQTDLLVEDAGVVDVTVKSAKQIADEMQAVEEAIAKRNDGELILKMAANAKVCRKEDGLISVGYTERGSAARIRVRVMDTYLIKNPSVRPSGFEQRVVEDAPENWHLCDAPVYH